MTEDEAHAWVRDNFGPAGHARLERFARLLSAEASRQNLISRASFDVLWSRHLADSAQLAMLAVGEGPWLDVGTGGGLPGLVVALLAERPFVLCEPRRLRADFLRACVNELGLEPQVSVKAERVEALTMSASVISARAVAAIDPLIAAARRCATTETIWILPRGQSGRGEIQRSTILGQGVFHVKQSLTDPNAIIIVAAGIGA